MGETAGPEEVASLLPLPRLAGGNCGPGTWSATPASTSAGSRSALKGRSSQHRRSSAISLAVVYRSGSSFRERLDTDAFHFFGNGLVPLPGWADLEGGDLLQHFLLRISLKGPPPREQLVHHHPQAEYVRAGIDPMPLATGLFGAHVGRSSGEARPFAHVLFAEGQPEIDHKRFARLTKLPLPPRTPENIVVALLPPTLSDTAAGLLLLSIKLPDPVNRQRRRSPTCRN